MAWDNGGFWDGVGTWDDDYVSLITSEHADKPHFVAVITALVQPFIDAQNNYAAVPNQFDIDNAVGDQLDILGKWIGVSRNLTVPLTGVYFSLDTPGLGFDQGTWLGPFDPTTQLDVLPDDAYRQLLRARIANNQWDGTVPGAYKFMEAVFPGNTFFIQDNGDMTMLLGGVGPVPLNAVSLALLTGSYLDIKPAGVHINGYVTQSVPNVPLFGFDVENELIAGFDQGCFATITGGN